MKIVVLDGYTLNREILPGKDWRNWERSLFMTGQKQRM